MIRDRKSRQYNELVKAPTRSEISVGIHAKEGDDQHSGGLSILDLGEIHEFGLGVPQRSFIRAWADENAKDNIAVIKSELTKSIKDGKPKRHLDRAALSLEGSVKQNITSGIEPELAAETIARKGSSTPLIDTGVLRASITGTARVIK